MHQSFKIYEFLLQKRREKKPPALWDFAEPISLDEIRSELAKLTHTQIADQNAPKDFIHEELSLDQLWNIFESLEDVDEYQMIF